MEQDAAVAAIERLGGKVMYEYQRSGPVGSKLYDPKARPKNPDGKFAQKRLDAAAP